MWGWENGVREVGMGSDKGWEERVGEMGGSSDMEMGRLFT